MNWLEQLRALTGQTVKVFALNPRFDDGSVRMVFSGRTTLCAHHWRVCEKEMHPGKARISSFDHGERYGLPEKMDTVSVLRRVAEATPVAESRYDIEMGDLIFEFESGLKLQVMNITGNEVWEIEFPDGTVEYSNYV